jgi:hypothetical protein
MIDFSTTRADLINAIAVQAAHDENALADLQDQVSRRMRVLVAPVIASS